MKQTLTIQYWVPEPVANGPHGHPIVKAKKLKAAQTMAWACAKQAQWKRVDGKARLSIVMVFPVSRRRDTDNLYSRAKGVIDGLKEWFVDDDTEHLDLHVAAVVERGVKETRIELEPV